MKLTGIAAAPGYAWGHAFLLEQAKEVERIQLRPEKSTEEVARFTAAVEQAVSQLKELQERTRATMGLDYAEIFESHIMVLKDEEFVGRAKELIAGQLINAEAALSDVTQELVQFFESMDNVYMNERAADFRDISKRLHGLLTGSEQLSLCDLDGPVVLIAHDLTPSDSAQLERERVAGFAANIGGSMSHSAIMARSMEIPAVVGLKNATSSLNNGDFVILDGVKGELLINPTAEQVSAYRKAKETYERQREESKAYLHAPSVTADGKIVELAANIGNPADAVHARNNGAEGIGLFRTELLFMGRRNWPTEEEQFYAYKLAAEAFGGMSPIVIRTLDIGGDKELDYAKRPRERNPFLGYRAIRLSLDERDTFKAQLRAILRASAFGNVKIMFPMIATLQELRAAKALLAEAKADLDAIGVNYRHRMEVGIMIEVPAAALISDQLAKEADFFSIGTNDLVQFTMAADRTNEKLSHLTDPIHPAVLRLIRLVIDNGHKEGKWVSLCGEMAGDLAAIPIMLGLGLDRFSMNAGAVLPARIALSAITAAQTKEMAEAALRMESSDEVRDYVHAIMPHLRELFQIRR
ncbi:phosphoenolpyruvate--protein phosphotransferase [Paenibacillus sp. MSJ-34]|uniref:phosphoenolpyruvate--protein phosphotransferase n=1 Tax=Paenibacillus sp. MSJ-34 TaxID=2841529 RepID=UPI001C120F42|nr:phosphoenolpyruvate--protein phosphotransferase [Paenibacillus sp. MSJ-34]MBU5440876.1 phosphoenolpyruvate--protein phosphotransferase [Paenibacillus sp. MSJ-34]